MKTPTQTRVVLLVDDDEDTRFIYTALLSQAGYRVLAARDGVEAVNVAWQTVPDLILLDLAMPRMDGLATLSALRADMSTRGVPVLALTANASAHEVPELLSHGFHRVLLKPIQPDRVLNEVRVVLNETSNRSYNN